MSPQGLPLHLRTLPPPLPATPAPAPPPHRAAGSQSQRTVGRAVPEEGLWRKCSRLPGLPTIPRPADLGLGHLETG